MVGNGRPHAVGGCGWGATRVAVPERTPLRHEVLARMRLRGWGEGARSAERQRVGGWWGAEGRACGFKRCPKRANDAK